MENIYSTMKKCFAGSFFGTSDIFPSHSETLLQNMRIRHEIDSNLVNILSVENIMRNIIIGNYYRFAIVWSKTFVWNYSDEYCKHISFRKIMEKISHFQIKRKYILYIRHANFVYDASSNLSSILACRNGNVKYTTKCIRQNPLRSI